MPSFDIGRSGSSSTSFISPPSSISSTSAPQAVTPTRQTLSRPALVSGVGTPQSRLPLPTGTVPSPPAHPGPEHPETPLIIADAESQDIEPQQTLTERIHDAMYEHSMVINTFIAGGLAGATSRTVVSPLERLKIILQVQTGGAGSTGKAYGGIAESLARMWREEGFKGFMKGNGINVVRILPYSALQFTSYGAFKSFFTQWSGEESLSTPYRLLAGAGAGIVAVSATYPLDLVRARLSIATSNMATQGSKGAAFSAEDAKLGIIGMTKKVYRTEGGIRALYRGSWATAVGVAPYVSLNFYLYESLRAVILPSGFRPDNESELVARKLTCGALAGGTSLLFTHPFDVVRRKLQVAGLSGVGPQYNGAIDCIRQIVKTEGFWKGLYRGLTPNIIKVTPSIAVSFYTFETVRDYLEHIAHKRDTPDEI